MEDRYVEVWQNGKMAHRATIREDWSGEDARSLARFFPGGRFKIGDKLRALQDIGYLMGQDDDDKIAEGEIVTVGGR